MACICQTACESQIISLKHVQRATLANILAVRSMSSVLHAAPVSQDPMNTSQFVGELILSKHSKPVDVDIHTGSFKLLQIYVSSLITGVHHSVSGLAH